MLIKMDGVDDLRELVFQSNMTSTAKISPNTAPSFEAMVLQATLKTNCIDQHFLDEPNAIPDALSDSIPCSPNGSAPVQPSMVVREEEAVAHLPLDAFIQSAWGYAKQAAIRLGLEPKVLMAQVALETGWGQFIAKDSTGISSNNLFNIKSKTGGSDPSVNINTTEYIDNTPLKMTASFKVYSSIEQSFVDYVALIEGNARYKTALAHTADPKQYMDALHEAGYATDPNYAVKILSIYQSHALEQVLKRNGCV